MAGLRRGKIAGRVCSGLFAAMLLMSGCAGSHGPGQRPARLREAQADATGPFCDSGGHAQSMMVAKTLTVSPEPGARDAGPQTQISLLGVPAAALSRVTVVGSTSGVHGGHLEPYTQGDGAAFSHELRSLKASR